MLIFGLLGDDGEGEGEVVADEESSGKNNIEKEGEENETATIMPVKAMEGVKKKTR